MDTIALSGFRGIELLGSIAEAFAEVILPSCQPLLNVKILAVLLSTAIASIIARYSPIATL